MLLDLLPQLGVLLDAHLLGGVELVQAAQVHVLGEQRHDVLVEGLPVRVLQVVSAVADVSLQPGKRDKDRSVDVGLSGGVWRVFLP